MGKPNGEKEEQNMVEREYKKKCESLRNGPKRLWDAFSENQAVSSISFQGVWYRGSLCIS